MILMLYLLAYCFSIFGEIVSFCGKVAEIIFCQNFSFQDCLKILKWFFNIPMSRNITTFSFLCKKISWACRESNSFARISFLKLSFSYIFYFFLTIRQNRIFPILFISPAIIPRMSKRIIGSWFAEFLVRYIQLGSRNTFSVHSLTSEQPRGLGIH